MSEQHENASEDLAAWLRDVGRRRWQPPQLAETGKSAGGAQPRKVAINDLEESAGTEISSREAGQAYRRRQIARESVMLLCLVAAYIQYHFMDVHLQIARLPSIVVGL